MRKIFFLAALGLSVMAQAIELDYYKTLVDEQADASKGTSPLYNLEYYADGSLLVLASYQTTTQDETGLLFNGQAYTGATASRFSLTTTMNALLAKLDANGNTLWAVPDTTYYFDLSGSASATTVDGGAIFAQKMKNKKGRFMTYLNVHNNTSFVTHSTLLSSSYVRTESMTADPNDSYAWAGVVEDENGYVYLAGYQADTIFPTWHDTIPMRPNAWNGNSGTKSSNCNTVILKFFKNNGDLQYVDATSYVAGLTYDRPLGLHYENGKLYLAGTYKVGTESGLYAACYNTDLTQDFIVSHQITGNLQFQQTKFEDGKILVCGGLAKNGSITIGEKTVNASATAANSGLIYVMDMLTGAAIDAAVHVPESNPLNITVAAFPTESGYVAYNHETLNGIQVALNYDENMNLVSADTIGLGGGSSTVSVVGRTADGNKTAVGLRARSNAPYYLLNEPSMQFTTTNWYSVIAVLNTESQMSAVETIKTNSDKAVKFIENGQLVIMYNGTKYNVHGEIME